MQNDLTHHSDNELLLWVENDEFLWTYWRKTLRTGNLDYIKSILEDCNFKYTSAQWEVLVDEFEEVMKAEWLEEENRIERLDASIS